jgi:hypothetical protein
LVFVTSWKPAVSSRRPVPWQLGHVVVSPNELPILRSPPQTPQTSSFRSVGIWGFTVRYFDARAPTITRSPPR